MCCGGMFNLSGLVISKLEPKQIVEIEKGWGYPAVPEKIEAVVWIVSKMSALTMDGTMLSCKDGFGITPKEAFDKKARPTARAVKVFIKNNLTMLLRKVIEWPACFYQNVKDWFWWKKYKLSKWIKAIQQH